MWWLFLAMACPGKPKDMDVDTGQVVPANQTRFSTNEAAGPDLAIYTRGQESGIPEAIVITSKVALFADSAVGKNPPGTDLDISPQIPGRLEVLDRYSLIFRPDRPFAPDTKYTATLKSLKPSEPGAVAPTPPSDAGWSHVFTTPGFYFRGAKLVSWDRKERQVTVALAWTAAVDGLPDRLQMRLDGIPVEGRIVAGGGDGEILVRLTDALFGQEKPPAVTLQIQIPEVSIQGGKSKAGKSSAEVRLSFGDPPMKILNTKVREGTKGFYMDVVCDDDAVASKMWWWDRESWDEYRVSERCMLDAKAMGSVLHFSPAVENLSIAPGEAGFRIFGDFIPGTSYNMTLDGGAETEDGGRLQRRYETKLAVPHRTPRIQFASSGRYLPRSAWRNLAVQHTNTEKVKLQVRHIPAENLVFWLTGNESASTSTSNLILEKELAFTSPLDTATTSYVDVGGLVPEAGKGVYELSLSRVIPPSRSSGEEEAQDTGSSGGSSGLEAWERTSVTAVSRLLRTDMHVIAKMAAAKTGAPYTEAVDGWVVDVHTNNPIGGVELNLVRPSGMSVGRCTTGGDGHCRIAVEQPTEQTPDQTAPFALLAQKGNDLTYLRFSDLRVSHDGDVSGEPWQSDAAYRTAPWTDRGVYRPGDTAHVAAVVRTDAMVAPAEAVPVLAKLYDARGKMIRQKVLTTNAAGLITWDVPFSTAAPTGSWSVSLEVAKRSVGSVSFKVEEFVPERLRVGAKAAKADYLAGEEMKVDVEADWLFGAPAADARYQLSCTVEPSAFTSEQFRGYSFGPASVGAEADSRLLSLGDVDGTLDAEGLGGAACPTSRALTSLSAPSRLKVQAAVFEGDSGRSTVSVASAPIHPERYYIGMKANKDEIEGGVPVQVRGQLVGWEGKGAAASALSGQELEVELIQLEEESVWTWDESEGRSRYRRFLRQTSESKQVAKVNADGSFEAEVVPRRSAGYLIVAKAGKARTELYLYGQNNWWYWSFDEEIDQTPRPEAPKPLPVDVPKDVKVGDRVPVKFQAPFAGKALLTVETDSVQRQEWMDMKAGENEWGFTVSEFAPNLYVSALLIKDPHLESPDSYLPDRAFGVKSVRVEPTKFVVPVALTVPAEIRPYSPLKVDLDLGPLKEPTWVTVSAIDEGILSLTKFVTPDPTRDLFARRRLGVESFETIGWTLLSAPAGSGKRTGGDEAGAMGRIQMVKPVALWSGAVEVPASGKASVSFDIPGYRGELRVMAVAAGKSHTGHAEAAVKVRDPLVLQTTLPRFLMQGDTAEVPIQVTNMSGSPQTVAITVEAEGIGGVTQAVEVSGGGSLKLAKEQSGSVKVRLKGLAATGGAKLVVRAKAGSLESREELEIPLQPPRSPARQIRKIDLPVGTVDLRTQIADFIPGTELSRFWVTTNPYAPAMSRMRYLIRYPYGCIEQTSSAIRPMLYLSSLLPTIDPDQTIRAEEMVGRGIERLMSMQTPSGGFGYWPGADVPHPWGTAYATHVLLDAKKAGYPVSEESLQDALSWLGRLTESSQQEGKADTAYAHYVLALAGKGRATAAAAAIKAISKDDYARNESRYLLEAAMYLAGDRRFEADLRAMSADPILLHRYNGWYFYSDLREQALRLSVYRDLFGDDKGGDALADRVAEALSRQPEWRYTTQELAWAITGLGKTLGTIAPPAKAPTVTRDGQAVAAASGKGDTTFTVARGSLASQLTMQVPDNAGGHLYLISTVEGSLKVDDRPSGGQGLQIERAYQLANGEPLEAVPAIGDAIYVHLKLTNTSGFYQENIALVDQIPAGWEIENPRLGRGGMPEWVDADELWGYSYMNLRDDRVEFFGGLSPKDSVEVVYMVRAVTAGTYTLPGSTAEAMYDPEMWARLESGSATVRTPGQPDQAPGPQ